MVQLVCRKNVVGRENHTCRNAAGFTLGMEQPRWRENPDLSKITRA